MTLVGTPHKLLSDEQHGLSPAHDGSRAAGGSLQLLCVGKVSGSRTDTSKHCGFEASIFRSSTAGRSQMASSCRGQQRVLATEISSTLVTGLCMEMVHCGFRAAHSKRMKRIQDEKSVLGMTSSCCIEEADVCSYLQSFFLFPAEQPLLLGEHLAGCPTVGLPRQCSITTRCSKPVRDSGEGSPKGESSGHQAPLEVSGPAAALNKEAVSGQGSRGCFPSSLEQQ